MSSNKRKGCNDDGEETGKKPREIEELESDDELPKESVKDLLKWRTEDSFADWKIVITVKSNVKEDEGEKGDVKSDNQSSKECTYNVRKSVRADGPRRSEYFVRLFDGNFSEARDNTSRIELNELQAKAFPSFLDYMYSVTHRMSFTTDTATALYSLSKYFSVKRLQNEVKKFCLQDMRNRKRCGTYYEHAKILQEDTILVPAAKFCRENITRIDFKSTRLLHVPDPQFWLDVIKEYDEIDNISNHRYGSYALSGHIALYCQRHASVTSPEIFKQLTDERFLLNGTIDPIDALSLLDSERRIVGQGDEGKLSNLQTRCVSAIVKARAQLNGASEEWIRNAITQLPPLILVELVTRDR